MPEQPPRDIFTVMSIVDAHAEKNFVQRIISPGDYPKLYDGPQGELGDPSTHSMAWGEDANGNAFVYPTVVQGPDGSLRRLKEQEAWDYARQSGEFIPFGQDKESAAWFSSDEGYKQLWSKPDAGSD